MVKNIVDACKACLQVMSQKGSAAILASKHLAGVAREANLKNPWYAGEKVCKHRINPGLGRHHQKSKPKISVSPQNETDLIVLDP